MRNPLRPADPPRAEVLAYGALAAPLAFGGLPLYIHAPDFYAADLGVGLAALGVVLAALRAVDAVQDPLVGWAGDRWPRARPAMMVAGAVALTAGVAGLFAPMGLPLLVWFALMMVLASLGHSLISVNLMTYGGVWRDAPAAKARISGFREGFGLAGLILAVSLPAGLAVIVGRQASLLALATALAIGMVICLPLFLRWLRGASFDLRAVPDAPPATLRSFTAFYTVAGLVLLSAAFPAALILMLVRDLLGAQELAGIFLLAYFIAALPGAALASHLAGRIGAVPVWTGALILSVLGFASALALGQGTVGLFFVICLLTGLTFGADLVLPPAILSARIGDTGSAGIATRAHAGLAFLTKAALALAGAIALPLLAQAGFRPAEQNPEQALDALRWLYAGLPLVLRVLAIALLTYFHRKGRI
jgi:Na+/melibiose symporter-like transporter